MSGIDGLIYDLTEIAVLAVLLTLRGRRRLFLDNYPLRPPVRPPQAASFDGCNEVVLSNEK